MSKTSFNIVAIVAVLIAASLAGAFLSRRFFPRLIRDTKIQYVDRDITRRDTVTIMRPVTRTIYRQVTDTVRVEVRVPVDFPVVGVIAPTPIRFDRGDVILTYYAPDRGSFVQDRFEVRGPRFGYQIAPYVAFNIMGDGVGEVGLEFSIRYRAVSAFARMYSTTDGQALAGWGLRLRLKGRP